VSAETIVALFGAVGAIGIPLAIAFMKIGGLAKLSEIHDRELEKLRPVVHENSNQLTGLQGHALAADRIDEYAPQILEEIREIRRQMAERT
jgi:hypothetical protein